MNTRNLLRKLSSCLLGAIFAAGIASTMVSTTVNAVDGNPPGLFELEGNIPDGAAAGDDWGGLFAGTEGPNLITFTEILADPAPATIFTQGGSKDVNDVSAWKHTNGSVPDKDDITNAYAAAYNNPVDVCLNASGAAVLCSAAGALQPPIHEAGDLIVYFGLDRLANNGDAFTGFWFFQNEVSTNANGTFSGIHTALRDDPDNPGEFLPGDMFVIVNYPQASGAQPVVKVYQWDPLDADGDSNTDPDEKGGKGSPLDLVIRSADAECDGQGNKLACAIANLTPQASPPWPYTPKSGTGLPFESFFEGGINVTQLLGSTPCFASFLAETRSSASQTAQLKDFVLGAFPVCGASVNKTCEVATNQAGDTAIVTFSGIAENTGGQSLFIELDDNAAGSTFTAVCIDNVNAPNGACGDAGDTVPADLTLGTTASFTLAAHQKVVYEGTYSVTPITTVDFSDTVTLSFFASSGGTLLGTSPSNEAECSLTLQPDLTITKECDGVQVVLEGGQVVIKASNTITVTNNGQEALNSVVIKDDEVPTLVEFSGGANITCVAGSGQCTGSLALGEVVVLKQTYVPDTFTGGPDPSTVKFVNTASAEGVGAITGTPVGPEEDDAECPLCPPHTP